MAAREDEERGYRSFQSESIDNGPCKGKLK
jgi:hypothetical protein